MTADAELTAAIRSGRESGTEAQEELYRRHGPAVFAYARTCCRDPHTAEDLASEAFIRTLQAVESGRGPESAWRPYLLSVVRHTAADWAGTARRAELSPDFESWLDEAPTAESGEERLIRLENRALVLRGFRSLPERWQTVLWHTLVEGESAESVGERLGIGASGVGSLAARAREGLREAYLLAYAEGAGGPGQEECRRYQGLLAAAVRRTGRRTSKDLDRHLSACARCTTAMAELNQLSDNMRSLLPAALLLFGSSGYLTHLATASPGPGSGNGKGQEPGQGTGTGHGQVHGQGLGTGRLAGEKGADTAGAGAGALGSGTPGASATGLLAKMKTGPLGGALAGALVVAAVGGFLLLPKSEGTDPVAAPPVPDVTASRTVSPTPSTSTSAPSKRPSPTSTPKKQSAATKRPSSAPATSAPPLPKADDTTRLRIAATDKCMETTGGSGAQPREAACDGSPRQVWELLHNDEGRVQLRNKASQLCLTTITGPEDGSPVEQRSCGTTDSLQWWGDAHSSEPNGTASFTTGSLRLGLNDWYQGEKGQAHSPTIGTTHNYYNSESLQFRFDGTLFG